MTGINRRDLLQGAAALGALGCSHAYANDIRQTAIAVKQEHAASKPMTSYIGTATSRVDGRAKVTGEAKYAGEFDASGIAYGSVVESAIAKGCIARIDTSDALSVEGVLDVLTHQNRPPLADTDEAWKDEVAPE